MDCSLPGSFVHGILQARILELVAMFFSRGSSQPRDWPEFLNLLHWQVGSLQLAPPGKPLRIQQLLTNAWWIMLKFSSLISVQLSLSVVSNSLRPHEPQHARHSCPSPSPRIYTNSCPLSRWCHPTIPSSVIPFFSCLQSFQHQSLYKWVSSSHQVAKVLEFHLQHQSFQCTLRTDLL